MTMDNRSTQNKTSNRTSSSKTSNKTTSKTTGKVSGRATSSNSRNASNCKSPSIPITICTHKSAACFPKQALGIHAALFVYSVWAAASIASHTLEQSS